MAVSAVVFFLVIVPLLPTKAKSREKPQETGPAPSGDATTSSTPSPGRRLESFGLRLRPETRLLDRVQRLPEQMKWENWK